MAEATCRCGQQHDDLGGGDGAVVRGHREHNISGSCDWSIHLCCHDDGHSGGARYPVGFGHWPNGCQFSATTLGSTEQIADNATTGATSAVRAANTNIPVTASFIVAVSATGGTVQLQFRSEVAGSAVTMKANLTAMGRRVI